MLRLLVLLALIPILELVVIIEVGRRLGTGATVFLILATTLLGVLFTRTQEFAIFKRIQSQLAQGQIPTDGPFDAMLVLIGGLLLILPGFLTDTAGILLWIPGVRQVIKKWLRIRLERWMESGTFRIYLR